MTDKKILSTESYKGVRDFYPEDMAIQRYIFDTWSRTAELFGFERYDASVLEPAELYKSKGAENEEMVNEQTYTFIDRGDREVTLRPEMTPTVARLVAGQRRDLTFPVRWYSIPNLFRYERTQRGRLREHWQLNCDIFGASSLAADTEIITLAHQLFLSFGATPDMFEIRLNHRGEMGELYTLLGITNPATQSAITRLNDRYHKMSRGEYERELGLLVPTDTIPKIIALIEGTTALAITSSPTAQIVSALATLGITNVVVDRTIARGFDYYTGTIFEIFDVSGENNRSMLGGGRYDNLTALFGGEAITGIGFGMGDVTMRDFLATHHLLPSTHTAPTVMIIPTDDDCIPHASIVAQHFRTENIRTAVDYSSKKLPKKISDAATEGTAFVMVIGKNEIDTTTYTLKQLTDGTQYTGSLETLCQRLCTA